MILDPGSVKVLQQKSKFGNLSQVCTWSEGEKGTCDRVQQVGSLFSLPSKNPEPPWISPAQPPAADPSPPEDEPLRPTGPPSLGTSAPPQSSTPHSTVGFGSVEPPPPSLLSRETSKAHPRFCWSPKKIVHVKKRVAGWARCGGQPWTEGLCATLPLRHQLSCGGCRRLPPPSKPSSYHQKPFYKFFRIFPLIFAATFKH